MKRLAASCFGLGWLPFAPGTWGSLPAVFVFVLLCYTAVPAELRIIVMAVLALAASVVCLKCASAAIEATGNDDPREVVADEVAGQAITFLAVSRLPTDAIWTTAVSGFILFRLFDIVKPWPIRKLEKLPKALGVLADDLAAGVYAAIALLLCLKLGLVQYLTTTFSFGAGTINIPKSALLGVVQGLTEFLPVSSSGHLVLFETLFKLKPETPQMLLFDLVAHIGTVIAIFIVFRSSIAALFGNLAASGKYITELKSTQVPLEAPVLQKIAGQCRKYCRMGHQIYKKSPSIHLLVLGIFATFITGVCGLLFEDYFADARGSLVTVAIMWTITGTLLLITDWRKKTRLGLRRFVLWQAAVVGLAQAVAIMPGISRSGATICAAILLGLHRRWAVEFSFMIAIPAIIGATVITLSQDFGQLSGSGLPLSCILTVIVGAALAGVVALKILIKTSRKANLKFFAFYCYILAFFVLVYLLH